MLNFNKQDDIEELFVEENNKQPRKIKILNFFKAKNKKRVVKKMTDRIVLKKRRKNILVLVFSFLLLIIGVAIYFMAFACSDDNVEYAVYTVSLVDEDFSYEGATGVVVNDVEKNFSVTLNEETLILEETEFKKGDVILKEDVLFTYETRIIDYESKMSNDIETLSDGIISNINDTEITVLENVSFSLEIEDSFEPSINDLVLFDGGKGKVSSVSSSDNGIEVLISIDDLFLSDFEYTNVYFVSKEDESDTLIVTDGKVMEGEVEIESIYSGSALVINDEKTYSYNEIEDYVFNSLTSEFEVGEEVEENEVIGEALFNELVITDYEVVSDIEGLVMEIINSESNYGINVVDSAYNVVEFDLPVLYQDKIKLGQVVSVSTSEFEGEGVIEEIVKRNDQNIARVVSEEFIDLKLDATVDISVTGKEGEVLLIPKDYVCDSRVKKVFESGVEEVVVDCDSYNADYYVVKEGLTDGDTVEEY